MAQNTTTPTPFNTSIQTWIASHKDAINRTANLLGVPGSAIAAAMGEEATHIISDTVGLTPKGRLRMRDRMGQTTSRTAWQHWKGTRRSI
jgi:hypothetical protein